MNRRDQQLMRDLGYEEWYLGEIDFACQRGGLFHYEDFRKLPDEAPSTIQILTDSIPKCIRSLRIVRKHSSGELKVLLPLEADLESKYCKDVLKDRECISSLFAFEGYYLQAIFFYKRHRNLTKEEALEFVSRRR